MDKQNEKNFPAVLFLGENDRGICPPLDDAEHFKALKDSKKTFHRMDLVGLKMVAGTDRMKNFAELVQLVGSSVKTLHILGMTFPIEFVKIVSKMSNLESLHIIDVEAPLITENFSLDLNNLRELEIRGRDSNNSAMLFGKLTGSTLQTVTVLSIIGAETSTKPFANQRNIKTLVVDVNAAKHFQFDNMKLETIEVVGPANVAEILRNQDELRILKAAVHAGDMDAIASQAKNLQHLTMMSIENKADEKDFKGVAKLQKLQKLEVIYHPSCDVPYVNDSIGWVASPSLRELSVICNHPLSKQALAEVGNGLPQLERLTLLSLSSINGLNVVLQNHPNLKFLSWKSLPRPDPRPDFYFYQEGLQQKALEELIIEQPIDAHKDLPRLIHNLQNLKSFRHRSWDNVIQGVIAARPDVKISIV